MSRLIQAVAAVVLALWGLAAAHCKLEALPGLTFLETCCTEDAAPACPTDCESDGCQLVEKAGYRAEEPDSGAPPPLLIPAWSSLLTSAPPAAPLRLKPAGRPAPPPRPWLFAQRTAPSPRAPSSAS